MKLDEVEKVLHEHGYEVFYLDGFGFDIVARERRSILLKISENINSVKAHVAQRLRRISWFFDAKSFIVGNRRGPEQLMDMVIYHRYDMPAITPNTLNYILNGEKVSCVSRRGGLFFEINPDKIDVSMSDDIGVSRRCAYYYKSGEVPSVKPARMKKLKKLFGEDVTVMIEFTNREIDVKAIHPDMIQKKFSEIGLKSVSVREHICDVLAGTKDENVISKAANSERTLHYYSDRVKSACDALDLKPIFILRRKPRQKSIKDIPVVSVEELRSINDKKELLEMIEI